MEFETYLRFVLALVFVLALIGLIAWVARRFGLAGRLPATRGAKRLRIVEVAPIDARRRLVLIGRDGVEHLVLLGATSDLVIESGIAQPGFDDLVEAHGNNPA